MLLCGGFYPVGGKPKIISRGREGSNDRDLVCAIRDEALKYDLLIGFSSTNFDKKYLSGRLVKWGERPLPLMFHLDLYKETTKLFKTEKFMSCSLKTICTFFHIRGKWGETKGNCDFETWMKATMDKGAEADRALERIKEHNRADVAVLEPLYHKLKYNIRSISIS